MPISEATYKRPFPLDAMDHQSLYGSDIDWAPPAPQPEVVEASHPTVALVVDHPYLGRMTIGYLRFPDSVGNLSPLPDAPEGAYNHVVEISTTIRTTDL